MHKQCRVASSVTSTEGKNLAKWFIHFDLLKAFLKYPYTCSVPIGNRIRLITLFNADAFFMDSSYLCGTQSQHAETVNAAG